MEFTIKELDELIGDELRGLSPMPAPVEPAPAVETVEVIVDSDVYLQKKRNAEVFQDTAERCRNDDCLKRAINYSRKSQVFLKQDRFIPISIGNYAQPANIIISPKSTFEAAREYDSVAVLNFANALCPGGGVAEGARAQEEALCRVSTLYYSLDTPEARKHFYDPHKQMRKMGTDDILINREVMVFKNDDFTDMDIPFATTVITCAAPNLSGMNLSFDRGSKAREYLMKIMMDRIDRIFRAASLAGAENLILGAFGCGVFSNPPDMIALIMLKKAAAYAYKFKNIEFAIYTPEGADTTNIDAFIKTMARLEAGGNADVH